MVRYAMLMFDEHPFGRMMLSRALRDTGLAPAVVLQERSKLAAKRAKWYTRMLSNCSCMPPLVADIVRDSPQTELFYSDKNSDAATEQKLREADLDLLVFGGTRIVPPRMFNLPRHGSINAHPGLLPQVRGSLPVAWSIVKGIDVGVTLHKVAEELDAGKTIFRDRLELPAGATFDQAVAASCDMAGAQLARCIAALSETGEVPILTGAGEEVGEEFEFKWDDTVEDQARAILSERALQQQVA